MIEFIQLEQLIAFAEHGTLSKAAEYLHMSQPTLTRAMKKLEEEFGVELFEHKKNKLILNENGQLAVEYAHKILNSTKTMIESVKSFDRAGHTISVGSCAPAPLWDISPLLSNLYPDMTILSEIKNNDTLLSGLHEKTYHLIVLPEKITDDMCECLYWGEENLFISLHITHPFAKSESISLKDMDGENMLLYSEIGFWHDFPKKKLPHSRFLTQNERFAFNELVNCSVLPSFTSDITQRYPEQYPENKDRVNIPLIDDEAHVKYYCYYLKENSNRLKEFIHYMKSKKF